MNTYKDLKEKEKYFTCSTINSMDDLDGVLVSLKGKHYAFRGVKESKFRCYSSAQVNAFLKNICLSQQQLDDAMINMITAMRRSKKLMNICKKITSDETDMQLLGLLQHYSFGTTILDFSYCFNDAVFFALDGATYNHVGDISDYFSIYYFDINDPEHTAFQNINVGYVPIINHLNKIAPIKYGHLYKGVSQQTKDSFSFMPYSELAGVSRGGLTIGGGTKCKSFIVDIETGIVVNYNLNSDRLYAQNGLFKLSSRFDVSYEEAAQEYYSEMPKKIFCLNIHKSLIPELREKYLKPYNINANTIYPNSKKSKKLTKLLLKLPIDPIFRPRTKPQCLSYQTWMKYERIYKKRFKKKCY